MYKTLTADIFRAKEGLKPNYIIDGLLASGTWDLKVESEHLPTVRSILKKLDPSSTVQRIDGVQLGHAFEIRAKGKLIWYVPIMGTSIMSQYAHIASALGSKKNILIGTVGGLKKGIKSADFIIPAASKGNENALMYQRDAKDMLFYPDINLRNSIKSRLTNTQYFEGITTTCEVMFAETFDDVKNWSEKGYIGVEMEAAMIFALSNAFDVPSAALLYVADNLIEEVTLLHDTHQNSNQARLNARTFQYEVALTELLD